MLRCINGVRLFRRHDENFACVNQVLDAIDREAAGAFQNGHHRISGGIMGGDFFAFCKCKQSNADSFVLCQSLADDLTVFCVYQPAKDCTFS